MNKKKVLIRIGSVLACVLLVGALAIPCFADEPAYDIDGVRFDDEFVYRHFYDMYVTDLYASGLSLINSVGLERFFEYEYFFLGTVHDGLGAFSLFPLLYKADDTDVLSGEMMIAGVDFCFVYGPYYDMQSIIATDSDIEYSIYVDDSPFGYPSYIIDVYFTLSDGGNIQFLYRTDAEGEIYLMESRIGDIVNPEIVNFTVGFSDAHDLDFLGALSTLYFKDCLYPSMFKSEFIETYSTAYNEGYYEGFDDAFDYDYYEQVLEEALQDIDDGTFGRNFLGGMFAAPFEALNNFTIVSWVDSDGTTTTITLGLVLSAIIGVSLFIWFLKLFAGG